MRSTTTDSSASIRRALGKLKGTAEGSRANRPAWNETLHPFDREHGTDTGGYIPGEQLVSGQRSDFYNTAYYGISPSTLHARARSSAGRRAGEPLSSTSAVAKAVPCW